MSTSICYICNKVYKTNNYISFKCDKNKCFHLIHKQCYSTKIVSCYSKKVSNKYYLNNKYKKNLLYILFKNKLNKDNIFNIFEYIENDYSISSIIVKNNNKINVLEKKINIKIKHKHLDIAHCFKINKNQDEIDKIKIKNNILQNIIN